MGAPPYARTCFFWYAAPNRLQVFDVDTETFIEDINVLDGVPKADLVRRGKLLGNGMDGSTGEQTPVNFFFAEHPLVFRSQHVASFFCCMLRGSFVTGGRTRT